ncbi:MAG: fructosamine kinase family protein [Salibacteraceae bacterium]
MINKKIVAETLGVYSDRLKIMPVDGGSINDSYKIEHDGQRFFMKCNQAQRFSDMFSLEQKGLQILKTANAFRIPEVIGVYEHKDLSILYLEFIDQGPSKPDFCELFAERLIALHANSSDLFGLGHHNYIGSLPQNNTPYQDWGNFFVEQRIKPQLISARNTGQVDRSDLLLFDKLFSRIDDFFPKEAPSLIHGDLWSGNYMSDKSGDPVIFDPAIYFGHRYMDLGMMRLFGGFDQRIFDLYAAKAMLDHDWKTGSEIANLYPLLVHVNLFGSGYISQVRSILRHYVN